MLIRLLYPEVKKPIVPKNINNVSFLYLSSGKKVYGNAMTIVDTD